MSVPKEIADLVEEYVEEGLYGRLEFIFKNGKLTFIKKEETIVPYGEEVPEVRAREARY